MDTKNKNLLNNTLSDASREVLEILKSEKVSVEVLERIQQILEAQDEKVKIGLLLKEHIEKARKFAVVIYEEQEDGREKPIYWGKKMEDLSGYLYEEILERFNNGENIMELLYGHDGDQVERIRSIFKKSKETGIGYENFVCSLRTARGTIIEVAWNTERSSNNTFRMSFGSEDYLAIQKMLRMDDFLPCLKKSALKKDFREYVLNRRGKIEESKSVIALALIDIDDFKLFNESYGHGVGDFVLSEFVKFFNSKLRDGDHIYRLGGDEFAILFNTTKHDQIQERITRIKREFNSINFIAKNGKIVNSIKQASLEEALQFYESNKGNSNGNIVLPPIGLSIGMSDFNYSSLRNGEKSQSEVDSILEVELDRLKTSTDDILGIAKHCYLLDNEQYVNALDAKGILLNEPEKQLIQVEFTDVGSIISSGGSKKCKNFIGTPVFNENNQVVGVNLITNSGSKQLSENMIKIIQRRKERVFGIKVER